MSITVTAENKDFSLRVHHNSDFSGKARVSFEDRKGEIAELTVPSSLLKEASEKLSKDRGSTFVTTFEADGMVIAIDDVGKAWKTPTTAPGRKWSRAPQMDHPGE